MLCDPEDTTNPDRGVDRRTFLKASAIGGASLLAAPGHTSAETAGRFDPHARSLLAPVPFELEEASIAELQRRMSSGAESAVNLTEKYLARIEAMDRKGPALRAVLESNPEALAIAKGLDAERRAGKVRGPLHGIPILIKDNIDTADRMTTTAGSLALVGSIAPRDSFVAEQLRAAGAILLGKTNMSEWANFRSSHSTSGWSGRGGQCRNPYALDRNPCGSSSGSGAATSANFAAAAIGTETDGSIICPSSANGLVGIKPTVGLVSRAGIIPISHTQDTAGPMARTVADAATLLGALTGVDPRDPASQAAAGRSSQDYTPALDPEGLKHARIGVVRNFFGFDEHVDKLMEEALAALRSAGAELIDPVEVPNSSAYGEAENLVLQYEFKAGLNAYLSALGSSAPVKTLEDIIAFNDAHRDRCMPYFGQDTLIKSQARGPLTTSEYRKAAKRCRELSRSKGIDVVLAKQRLDALIAPSGGPAWTTDLVNGDHFTGGNTSAAAVAGYPSVTVPAGYLFGLPVGLSFIGAAFTEGRLIRLAYAFEKTTHARKAPRFLPTVDLSA
jgi:amidase